MKKLTKDDARKIFFATEGRRVLFPKGKKKKVNHAAIQKELEKIASDNEPKKSSYKIQSE